jgi:hypothetical protein
MNVAQNIATLIIFVQPYRKLKSHEITKRIVHARKEINA